MLNEHLDVNRQVHHLRTITCWTAACTMVLALLLSLGILTSCGSPIPTPVRALPGLCHARAPSITSPGNQLKSLPATPL
jgi:hypothetical protein